MNLRSTESTSKIPFIFLAGKTDASSYSYAMKLGASAYLSKLVPPHELLRVIAAKLK
jgi:PleD family two-component response regulator